MVAGVLAKSGYFMGNSLLHPNESSPKGFFEDLEINKINEALLAQALPKRPRLIGRFLFRDRPVKAQRWLGRLPLGVELPCPEELAERIRLITSHTPFCFKDPRFSYTLPVWRPYLKDAVYICVFRHPGVTANSIVTDCHRMPYLQNLSMSLPKALDVWKLMYQHILEVHSKTGEWLFLHYDQVFSRDGITEIENFLNAKADRQFPDASLRRSTVADGLSPDLLVLYERLCELARFKDP